MNQQVKLLPTDIRRLVEFLIECQCVHTQGVALIEFDDGGLLVTARLANGCDKGVILRAGSGMSEVVTQ